MKKRKKFIFLIASLICVMWLLYLFVMFFIWKVEIIKVGKLIEPNILIKVDNLDISTINSKAFIEIKGKSDCNKSYYNIKVFLYFKKGYQKNLEAKKILCKKSISLRLLSKERLPMLGKIRKIEVISDIQIKDYVIIWHNTHP